MAAIDDGWGVPTDTTESLIRLVPAADAFPTAREGVELDASALDNGWNLAEGTVEHAHPVFSRPSLARPSLPIAFSPAPLPSVGSLGPEQQAEFSKPDLALGTDIDLPPPSGAWFAELTGLVPRSPTKTAQRPASSAPQELTLKSCFSEVEDAFFATGDELELDHQSLRQALAHAEASPAKKRWWQRRKRN